MLTSFKNAHDMECECSNPLFFHRGWRIFFSNIIYQITGYELLDGMTSKRKRGVYIIVMCDMYSDDVSIKYIGSSKNMHDRLYRGSHHVFDKLYEDAKNSTYRQCIVLFIDTSKYIEIEKLLIKSLRPELNITHNG